MFVMYLSNFDSLRATQQRYYEQQRFADVFASLKRAPLRSAADDGRHPGRLGGRGARGGQRHARSRRDWTNRRPAGWSRSPRTRRPSVNDLFLRRGRWIEPGPARRSAGERGVRHRPRAGARRSRARRHQRAAAPAHHRRRGAFARVHLQHPSRRVGSRRSPLRHLLDGAAGARRGVRHGGRVQRPGARPRARDVAPKPSSSGSTACSSRTAASAPSRARCSSRTGPSRTSSPSCKVSASCSRSSFSPWRPSSSTWPSPARSRCSGRRLRRSRRWATATASSAGTT